MSAETRQTIALIVVPALGGCLVAALADHYLVTRAVLWLEPVIWIVFCSAAMHLVLRDRLIEGIGLTTGWMLFAAALRLPVGATPPSVTVEVAAVTCTPTLDALRSPTTLVSAHWSPSPSFASQLTRLRADLIVISGMPDRDAIALSESLGLAMMGHDGTSVLVRGQFQTCQGQGASHLPGGLITMVALDNGNTLPLITLAGPTSADQDGLAAAGLALHSPQTIALGHVATHGTFRHAESLWIGAGLHSAPHRATWPAQIGTVPLLSLYHTDRAWVGDGWRVDEARTVRLTGSRRQALRVVLEPTPI